MIPPIGIVHSVSEIEQSFLYQANIEFITGIVSSVYLVAFECKDVVDQTNCCLHKRKQNLNCTVQIKELGSEI